MNYAKIIGNNLKEARKAKGYTQKEIAVKMRMTQQQLADAAGVSRQTVNAIESGRFVPSTMLALKMARIFGTSVENLFSLDEEDI